MAPPLADTPLRPPPPLRPPLLRARPLRPGDRIALVAPSRPADPERVRASISYLEGTSAIRTIIWLAQTGIAPPT